MAMVRELPLQVKKDKNKDPNEDSNEWAALRADSLAVDVVRRRLYLAGHLKDNQGEGEYYDVPAGVRANIVPLDSGLIIYLMCLISHLQKRPYH